MAEGIGIPFPHGSYPVQSTVAGMLGRDKDFFTLVGVHRKQFACRLETTHAVVCVSTNNLLTHTKAFCSNINFDISVSL